MREFASVSDFAAAEDEELGVSDWMVVDQARVDAFADATEDRQWIHVDTERAVAGPFGSTIAHGYLTLSLIPKMLDEIYAIKDLGFGVNYGAERLRFPAPLPTGSRIRARVRMSQVQKIAIGTRITMTVTVESDTTEKPVCVVDIIFAFAD